MKKECTRPEDCSINDLFVDANDPEFWRNDYCEKNCQFRCVKGLPYKKRRMPTDKETENTVL